MFFGLLSYVGIVTGSVALVFVIATALYYISDVIEEHSVPAKRYTTRYIQAVIVAHICLWLGDGLPFWRTAFSIATNYVYLIVMRSFPVVKLSSSTFIAAFIGAVASHFMWFSYFTNNDLPPYTIYQRVPSYQGETLPPFSQIATFFGLLIWAVPFMLFLSLTVNDHVLPTNVEAPERAKLQRKGLARHAFDKAWQWIVETAAALGVEIPGQKTDSLLI